MDTVTANCKNTTCNYEWRIRVMVPVNAKNGWWIIKCSRCNKISELYIGPGVYDSLLLSGGTILLRLDSETQTEETVKEKAKKFGMA